MEVKRFCQDDRHGKSDHLLNNENQMTEESDEDDRDRGGQAVRATCHWTAA
jgi:hypothetical protein